MGCDVYANNNEIACKAGDNKVIADMPDVCLSPPSPPAGPIPVPYPDTSFSKDMQSGSKTVMIKGQEVMLKDQSFYKTSPLGDEAATNSFGANIVSHVITGKTYFLAWSMDVKFEGQNVDRHLDITTSNNASPMSTTAPGPSLATMIAAKKAAGVEKKRDPKKCGDNHKWNCNTRACAKCWEPTPCQANADQQNKEYQETQEGGSQDKIDRMKASNNAKRAKQQAKTPPQDDIGAEFENKALDKSVAAGETVEFTLYFAHCENCHMEQEVDIVTDKAVKECKHSAGGFKASQMKRIVQIRDACFPGKDVKCVTTFDELNDPHEGLKKKLAEKEYKNLGLKDMGEDP